VVSSGHPSQIACIEKYVSDIDVRNKLAWYRRRNLSTPLVDNSMGIFSRRKTAPIAFSDEFNTATKDKGG